MLQIGAKYAPVPGNKVSKIVAMYVVEFNNCGKVLTKTAKDDKELWRLICTYSGYTQKERERLFKQIKEQHGNL